jgi:FdhD protein
MVKKILISSVHAETRQETNDLVAIEEPLEIQLQAFGQQPETVSITMRTPGDDLALAMGFLWGEGVLTSVDQVDTARSYVIRVSNQVCIALTSGSKPNISQLQRNFYTTSSCGVCGKSSLDLIEQKSQFAVVLQEPLLTFDTIHALSGTVRREQATFEQTGGLHAAALLDSKGTLIILREDVGRHNAVDKVIGSQILTNQLPLWDKVLFLSGRASFELIQKAGMAGIAVVAAVGAPSSLAVELAQSNGITLIGFLRDGRFNIYSGSQRTRPD